MCFQCNIIWLLGRMELVVVELDASAEVGGAWSSPVRQRSGVLHGRALALRAPLARGHEHPWRAGGQGQAPTTGAAWTRTAGRAHIVHGTSTATIP
jgi:hypothetical protein